MRKFLTCILAASSVFPAVLRADSTDGFSYLLLSPAVRSAAIADAYVSIADGPDGVYSNPAGLGFENYSHFYAQSFIPPFLEGMKYNNFAYIQPKGKTTWSVQSGIMHVGNFTRTVADGSSLDGYRESGDFSTYDYRLSASFGQSFAPDWSFGATGSYLRESLADDSANAFSGDFGVMFKERDYPVQIGAALRHLGTKPKFKDESIQLPTVVQAGISFHQIGHFFPRFVPQSTIVTADFFKPLRGTGGIRGGFELPLTPSFQLRAGYQHSFSDQELGSKLKLPNGLSFGLGIQFKSFRFDYASSSMGELGLLHRIAVDYKWDAYKRVPRILSDSYAR